MTRKYISSLTSIFSTAYALLRSVRDDRGEVCDFVYSDVNPAFEKTTGLSPAAVLGKTISDAKVKLFYESADRIGIYAQVLKTGLADEFDAYAEPLNKWFRVFASTSHPEEVEVHFLDITDVVNKAEEQYVLNTILNDLVFELDEEYRFLNAFAETDSKLFLPKDKLIGRTVHELYPPETAAGYIRLMEKARQSGRRETATFPSITPGNEKWFTGAVKYTHINGEGRFVVSVTDITEQRQLEAKMRENEVLFRNIFDQAPLGISLGKKDGRIFRNEDRMPSINPMFAKITGRSIEDLMGLDWTSITHPDDVRPDMEQFERFLRGEIEGYDMEKRYIRPDGSVVWARLIISPLKVENEIAYDHLVIVEDITERKRMEEKLAQSELLFRAIFNQAPIGIAIGKNEYTFRRLPGGQANVNPMFEKIVGRTMDELDGMSWQSITHPDDLDKDVALYDAFHRGEIDSYNMVKRYLKPDGSPVWIHMTISPLYTDKDGTINHICLVEDITEQKRMGEQLQESERSKAVLLDNLPGMAYRCLLDRDWTMSYISGGCLELTGYPPDVLLGDNGFSFNEFILPAHRERVWEAWNEGICAHRKVKTEYEITTASGQTRWVLDQGQGVYDEEGNVLAIEGLITDISANKAAESALRESERSKAVLLDNLPGMAYRCEYDTEWTMRYVSGGCYEVTGYPPDALLNNALLSFNDLILPRYRDALWQVWKRVVLEHGRFKEEYEIQTASGEVRWVLEQGQAVYDDRGGVIALEGLIIDINDRKKQELEIRYLNDHDILTGLYNRRYIEEQANQMIRQHRMLPLTLMVVDINGIRLINDAFGYSEGDRLIRTVAAILDKLRRPGDLLARTGGDVFSILMPATDDKPAAEIAMYIQSAINEYNVENDDTLSYEISVTTSHATATETVDRYADLVKAADSFLRNRKLLNRQSSHSDIITSIMTTLYEKSEETEAHAKRLAELSCRMGALLGLTQQELMDLELFSMLHDIGKVVIDDHILKKADCLTEEEWNIMRTHPMVGSRIAKAAIELEHVAGYILTHHEHWDGSGYPQGLAGAQIPRLSRILAVSDAFDAMTSDRVYRKAMSREAAVAEIQAGSGKQFDPKVVEAFMEIISGGDAG